jgi:hypothetical protein
MKSYIYNIIKNRFKEIRLLLNNNFIFNLIIYSLTLFQFIFINNAGAIVTTAVTGSKTPFVSFIYPLRKSISMHGFREKKFQ